MSELPLETYYDLTRVGEVAVSPDGDRVAFTTTEFDPEEDEPVASLFVAPADGSREPHRLTRLPGAGSPKWSPGGDRLAFLAGREEDTERRVGQDGEEENGGDEPESQVWLFDLALGGDASQLTEFEEGVREFDWSPDGDRLVVSARDPDEREEAYLEGRREENAPIETERLQHKLDGVGYTDTVTTYLFVVSVEDGEGDGEPDRLDDAYGGGAMEGLRGLQPAWGAGDRIAFLSTRTDEPDDTMVTDVYTISPDGSDLERVTDGDLSCGAPAWSPSGDRLAFAAGDPENWCVPSEVYVHDGESYGSLTPELDRTVARGGGPQWTDEETIHVPIADESRTRLLRIDGVGSGTDGDDEGWKRVFAAQGDDRGLAGFHADPESDRAALVLSHPNDGQDVHAVDVEDLDASEEPESLVRLSEVNGDLIEEHGMPEAERVEWESDGWTIDGVLYTPPEFDAADGPAPLVVAIHGGPISYDEPTFRFDHAVLTSRGYAVLRPNYRGGASRGRKFAETLRGRWGTVEVEDIAAGVEFAVEEGIADPDRVFGYGFSYGGIAQGFLVTQRPDLFTAAAPEHGIYDLRSAYGTDDSHNWMENEYGLPWEVPEEIDASSAILDADEIETPLLITAGQEDWRCPPTQSEQLYVAAKKSAGEARLVLYPEEHHSVSTPDRAIHRLEEVLAWYRRHDPAVEDDAEDIHGRLEDDEDENDEDADGSED